MMFEKRTVHPEIRVEKTVDEELTRMRQADAAIIRGSNFFISSARTAAAPVRQPHHIRVSPDLSGL